MTPILAKITELVIAIENTIKDESDSRLTHDNYQIHDQTHIQNMVKDRAKYEDTILEITPKSLPEVAKILVAIADMIERGERSNIGEAINAIGERIYHENYLP